MGISRVREILRERWTVVRRTLFGKKLGTVAVAKENAAEIPVPENATADTPAPEAVPAKPKKWLNVRDVAREISAACAGAAVGVVVGQIVLPALTPNLERWAFIASTFLSVDDPQFLTIASKEEVDARPDTVPGPGEWELNRVFCGLALFNTKYCLMQPVLVTVGKKLKDWPLDRRSSSTVKALFIGDNGKDISVSWMSQQYGTGGWAHLGRRVGTDFVGYGIGCVADSPLSEKGKPFPIKVLVGELTSDPVTDLKAFQVMLLEKMSKSTMQMIVQEEGQEDCGKVQELKPDLSR